MATKVNTAKVKPVKKDGKQAEIDEKIALIDELESKRDGMAKDRDAKCKSAKEQLVSMLEVTVDKYRTATGTAEALRVLRFTCGKDDVPIYEAMQIANRMAVETDKMKQKAEELGYAEMDQLCDGFYDKEFSGANYLDLAFEMMRIDLCRNVGDAAEDMVAFLERVDGDIADTEKKILETQEELSKLKES